MPKNGTPWTKTESAITDAGLADGKSARVIARRLPHRSWHSVKGKYHAVKLERALVVEAGAQVKRAERRMISRDREFQERLAQAHPALRGTSLTPGTERPRPMSGVRVTLP
jgi:hypothetical protein